MVMKIWQLTKKADAGKLTIDVPKEFEGKELKISISIEETFEESPEKWHLLPADERLKILKQYQGTAKYPEVQIDKYDVYDQ